MDAKTRRDLILKRIEREDTPISATSLAKDFSVSRQLIVGDIALLRASGKQIIATPRGYRMNEKTQNELDYTIAVVHRPQDLQDELETIVKQGGRILNVMVEHPLYGELCGNLHINSLYDVEQFIASCESTQATPLSTLTQGVHLHTVRVDDEAVYERIIDALRQKGYLYQKEK